MEPKLCLIVCDYPNCANLRWFNASDAVPYKVCGGCKYMYYCGRDCQANHWKNHKHDCSGLKPYVYGDVIREQMERKFAPTIAVMYQLLKHPVYTFMREMPIIPFKTMVDMTLAETPNIDKMKNYRLMLTMLTDKIAELGIENGYVVSVRGLQILVY